MGNALNYLFRSRDALFSKHLQAAYDRLPAATRGSAFTVFIYSHTHRSDRFDITIEDWTPTILNTGAWQRVATPRELADWAKADNLVPGTLPQRSPESLKPCYGLVRIPSYKPGEQPKPVRLSWRQVGGTWKIGESCG